MKRLIQIASNELDGMEVADYFNSLFKDVKKILEQGLNLSENDFDNNLNKYTKFNNCSLEDFFKLIDGSPLMTEIVNEFNCPYDAITRFVLNDVICENGCRQWLKDFMRKIHNDPHLTEQYKGFGNSVEIISSAKELLEIKDKIGDVTKLKNFIDFNNRDKGWLIIYPNIYLETKNGESHTDCLHRWCKENNIDFSSDKTKERLSKDELKNIDINKCSMGHIVDDMAFIEDIGMGITIQESLKVLEKHNFKKVYEYIEKEKLVRRLK